MKNSFKKVALTLSLVFSTIIATTPIVEAKSFESFNKQQDFYAEKKVETINIDGINYKYSYSYENNDKVITITNNSNNNIEKVVQDKTGDIYLNDEIVISEKENIKEQSPINSRAYYEWETKSYSNYYISWAKATSAATLAAIIATKVGTLGPYGVIAAMGIGALGVIASQCAGGRVYVKIQMYRAPFTNPQYRTIWGFKAGTGDYYGNYIYHH